MFKFIKRIFAWWDGATLGMLLTLKRRAVFVFEDDFGNKYYEERKVTYDGRKRRWVVYKGYADASRVPPEWHGWLHHMYDNRPNETPLPTAQPYEKEHLPNMTGTVYAYHPKGSLARGGQREKVASDYESWSPEG
ncbi:MAG: NADH:ubiquinone oxidoreductase subunit NDUFA12 [Robiginitomaculum sp.]|nr:MAG: NADH:ubiquinone oxidoreductase subunit NDUFA12 [Robiginitomaculum sp.]